MEELFYNHLNVFGLCDVRRALCFVGKPVWMCKQGRQWLTAVWFW